MKKYMIFLFALVFAMGCGRMSKEEKPILVKINNYEITQEEFETEFKESPYARNDALESRKEFLNNLINRKLILQDAQDKGLDKDKGFLKMIERFWEQSLLKIALDKKAEEISGSVSVSEREIARFKESEMMNEWLTQLRKEAQIKINEELLKDK